jgi:hypothetical protein
LTDPNVFFTANSNVPGSFTLDLGVEVKLSRFNMVPFWEGLYVQNPKKIELYGTTSLRPGDDFEGGDWTLIGKFESWKPSGDDPLLVTDDDIAIYGQAEKTLTSSLRQSSRILIFPLG